MCLPSACSRHVSLQPQTSSHNVQLHARTPRAVQATGLDKVQQTHSLCNLNIQVKLLDLTHRQAHTCMRPYHPLKTQVHPTHTLMASMRSAGVADATRSALFLPGIHIKSLLTASQVA